MGDTICGPFIVQTTENTPFEIVLGCDYSNTIEQIYLEEETFETHNNLFGSYTVYKSITGFEDRVD
jgi:hypothetical protein